MLSDPLQDPLAVHDVALVEDHVIVSVSPLIALAADAEIVAVGAGAAGAEDVELPPPPPPHAVNINPTRHEKMRDFLLMAL